ncbi:DNA (cytosine-5-)-methyltransferase [Candidatus Dojkabacteria bacterium]|uniref:Cytosine-specific methyltransferase n=1 Tax=Candidatus Dojkabacteria bacterium TaxID=2099670 RepID=A0A955I142_9BACT|nr:DNA (cytosine-5-)-methyltransferase [Candidatus Dojkabacteria bacterium]
MKTNIIEAIDLFCGIGGLTYGLRHAGINVLAGLDNDESCQYAYETNNSCKFVSADIAKYNFSEMKDLYSKDSIKVLVGCAPCQPFSSHTYKVKRKICDLRWDLIKHFVRAIQELKPHIISMENVRGLTKTDVFKEFINDVKSLGYEIDYQVVYAPDYGIPQNRSRLVLIGSRIGLINIPEATHKKDKYTSVSDVIGKLPPIEAGEISEEDPVHRAKNLSDLNQERIRQSIPNGTWRDWDPQILPNCYKKESGQTYTSVYGRMSWNSISPTITTQFYNYGSGRFGHPEQNRGLSLREGALLQTFPKDYDFGEEISLSKIGRHIGNAVPPRLGTVIGEAIIRHVEKRNGTK